ncbi:sialidase family protein [Ohtaekwangia sp.]|uniref:sialidase family protein n=1 Tax=Ohtaekwangia sp. TaxID=2066019 RepID=UPI002FDDF7BA
MKNYTRQTSILLALTIAFACKQQPAKQETVQTKQDSIIMVSDDFVFGDNRPFPQCHASTLVRADDGTFLVAWFGGTHEKHDDVGIWLSKGKPGRWSVPIEVAKLREEPHWNPVLQKTSAGSIILYFKVGKPIDVWETWYIVSGDNGATWSQAKELVRGDKGGRGPVRNKVLALSNGTWLAPASNELKGVWNAFVDRSEDEGKTWQATPYLTLNRDSVPGEGIIQPTLWESAPGKVHMLLRSSAGVICRSDSEDYGKTWSPVYKTNLPNPNSGIDLTRLDDGKLVLIFNRDGKNWGARRPVSMAISDDNGKTWPVVKDIEVGEEGDEFSYPAIIHFHDTVALTYTWKRQRIAFKMARIE